MKELELSSICKFIDYRGKTPDKKNSGIPLITAKIVKNGRVEKYSEFIAIDEYETWMRRGIPLAGDVILTTEAPLGEVAEVPQHKVAFAQRIIVLSPNREILFPKYLKYVLQSPIVQNSLHARATGSVVTGIKSSELQKVLIPVVSMKVQKKIAHILGSIDDKIEINNKMNQTLQAIAKAMFKEWFIDFGPVKTKAEGKKPFGMNDETADLFPDSFDESQLGLIPKGWCIQPISEIVSHQIGGGWGKETKDQVHATGSFVIRGTDLAGLYDGKNDKVPYRFHKNSTFNQRKLSANDIIFEVSGGSPEQPIGRHKLIFESILNSLGGDVIPASFCKLIRLNNSSLSFYINELFDHCYESDQFRPWIVQSTGISNFKFTEFLEQFEVVLPSEKILNRFEAHVAQIYHKIGFNGKENRILEKIRDLLLPKLIAGEIDLKD